MIIRHQYNSASLYESCGYERSPAYPAAGQPVRIHFRAEELLRAILRRLAACLGGERRGPAAAAAGGARRPGRRGPGIFFLFAARPAVFFPGWNTASRLQTAFAATCLNTRCWTRSF